MNDIRAVQQAKRRYAAAQKKTDEVREQMFDVWAAAAMAGLSPEDIAQHTDFSAAYVRKIVRDRGVEPAARGPKSKK